MGDGRDEEKDGEIEHASSSKYIHEDEVKWAVPPIRAVILTLPKQTHREGRAAKRSKEPDAKQPERKAVKKWWEGSGKETRKQIETRVERKNK